MLSKGQRDKSNKRFKEALAKKGIYRVIYSLRHSFVSHLFDLGLSLDDIKVVAGHTKANMTRMYTHPQMERIRETLGKLE